MKRLLFTAGCMIAGLLNYSCGPIPNTCPPLTPIACLQAELTREFAEPGFETATWGVVVQSLKNGQYLYRLNENKGFMPASNMKLFTTATALVKLAPDFHYQTYLITNGKIENGILQGDLIIQGSGDPSITGRFHNDDPLTVFQEWVESLKSLGITKINGRIIGDDNYFSDEIMGTGWSWDYESDWYAAQISALSFNDNCLDIYFTPASEIGNSADFRLRPDTHYVTINNQVTTVSSGLARGVIFNRKRAANDITISGTLAVDETPHWEWCSVENPTLYTVFVFRELLEKAGISVAGSACDIDSLADFHYANQPGSVLASYTSPPLSEIVTAINKVSQNLYAELLLRTLGKQFTDVGDADHGIQIVRSVLEDFGADPNQFVMVDGSGLARLNLITPMHTAILLRAMRRQLSGDIFYNSLPIAGVDGTIKGRMKKTAAENNVHAKTGFIGSARSLSGYITTADGEELSFVMMVNNYTVPTSEANRIQDWVCERLANFHRTGMP